MKTRLAAPVAAAVSALSFASLAAAQSAATYAAPGANTAPSRAESTRAEARRFMLAGGIVFGSMYALNGAIAVDHPVGGDPVQRHIGELELVPGFGPFLAIAARTAAATDGAF